MRIMHVVNELVDNGNGIVNVAVDLACTQSADGHDVSVVSRGGDYVELVTRTGVTHHDLPLELSARGVAASRRSMREILRANDPDIVHSHTLMPAGLLFAIRAEDRFARRGPHYRLVTTVHNEYQRGAFLMGASDLTVSVSTAVDEAMGRRHVPASRRSVVHNGVIGSPRRRAFADVAPAEIEGRSILALGAVSHRKGSDVLVSAFEKVADDYPDLSVYFVGNPDWTEEVQRAKTLPCADRIHFVGLDREPARYLKAVTMMVLPSRRDPFPLVLLEAREAGVPIVASRVDGIPEALAHGEAGRLFPVGDADALAGEIRALLDSDSDRAALAKRSGTDIEQFTVRRMTDDYVDLYLDQLALGSLS